MSWKWKRRRRKKKVGLFILRMRLIKSTCVGQEGRKVRKWWFFDSNSLFLKLGNSNHHSRDHLKTSNHDDQTWNYFNGSGRFIFFLWSKENFILDKLWRDISWYKETSCQDDPIDNYGSCRRWLPCSIDSNERRDNNERTETKNLKEGFVWKTVISFFFSYRVLRCHWSCHL